MPAIATRHRLNLISSLSPRFAASVAREIRRNFIRVVRIHVGGDFYSKRYIRNWIRIVRACPTVQFFAYTRSWRKPKLLPLLKLLGNLPNMQLWWSEDRDTGPSPLVPGIRIAYLVVTDEDEKLVPSHADLVFRDRLHVKRRGRMKQIEGIRVCPHELDVTSTSTTCTQCQLCIRPPRVTL